jgi:hypothetical protein
VRAPALVALVVVHAPIGHVFAMEVSVVEVVDVVAVHDGVVAAAGTMGVAVHFCGCVLNSRHAEMLICADAHDKRRSD